MATEKRDRQRANRQLKQIQQAKQDQRRKATRRAIWGVGGVVAALALVLGLAAVGGAFSDDEDSSSESTLPAELTGTTQPATTALDPVVCPPAEGSPERVGAFAEAPPTCIDASKTYTAEVVTNKGTYTAELDAERAPLAVNSFVTLARYRYFDGTPCHRIIPGFVVQCGDPTGSGSGGPGYEFADELPEAGEYELGSLAMANSGADTNGSQFFVITGDEGVALQPNYTLFGTVTEGFDTTVKALEAAGTPAGEPSEPITIESITITES